MSYSKKKADIYARNVNGDNALHVAAARGHKDVVEFFLDRGMSVSDPDKGG
ncbi:ankyrin repeat domain-containing protein [Wolbachia endosymbiont of Tettigetta isshikii]|uniref:ankyrin repeat domain-containing protein n=1 Tax=Wolbachia endosymbiont of Tettigetta isshikii TaxID=3239093 RepID=UPI00397FD4F0